jgi:hypothetical protein
VRHPLVGWFSVGAMLEVAGLALVGILYVLNVVGAEEAQQLAVKGTIVIVILTVSGGIIGMLLSQGKDTPKA